MTGAGAFSEDYATARARFRAAAADAGYDLEAHPVGERNGNGLDLTIDTARLGDRNAAHVVIVSSGLHGVEGFFGSAVQCFLLEETLRSWSPPAGVALVLAHALNPYGFAQVRRFDEQGIDLNRNFLLPGETYEGAPARYRELDTLLNPTYPPSYLDTFLFRAGLAILRYGFADLKEAVAGGQYDYPKGLFFGGHAPARVHELLDRLLPAWIGAAETALHIDFHTGLGRWGEFALLFEFDLDERRRAWLAERFGPDRIHGPDPNDIAYHARGALGRWGETRFADRSYTLVCAEFGTYHPLNVLRALRDENQAHHWGTPEAPSTVRAKAWLREAFAPSDVAWRETTVRQAATLVRRALEVAQETSA
jgi:hypothetical protein